MTRERTLMLLGFLVVIAPWSGLPLSWLEWILPLLGFAVIASAFIVRGSTSNTTGGTPDGIPILHSVTPQTPSTPEPRSSHIAFS